MSESSEQNKTEEPTPFKLKKAREKGNIPKGNDLPFFAVLAGLALFLLTLGDQAAARLMLVMENSLSRAGHSKTPNDVYQAISEGYGPSMWVIVLIGSIMVILILLIQIIQTRGLLFSAHPMKPDFTKLNPAQGLKKIFSMKTLKEALKNIFKMMVYVTATFLVIRYCVSVFASQMTGAETLIRAMNSSGQRLLYVYIGLSLVFAAIDQIIVRKEYHKQMRMSKSELKREVKDREGEPRQKQKRKQLHEEFAKQTAALGDLGDTDVIITNPQHYAVALSYKPDHMKAPKVTSKGRNKFAQHIKAKAFRLDIPIIRQPPLARAIFKNTRIGSEISQDEFHQVASIYIKLRQDGLLKQSSDDEGPDT